MYQPWSPVRSGRRLDAGGLYMNNNVKVISEVMRRIAREFREHSERERVKYSFWCVEMGEQIKKEMMV